MQNFTETVNMNNITQLATEIASLSNADMHKLSMVLVKNYPTRADILETQISTQFFDSDYSESEGELTNG